MGAQVYRQTRCTSTVRRRIYCKRRLKLKIVFDLHAERNALSASRASTASSRFHKILQLILLRLAWHNILLRLRHDTCPLEHAKSREPPSIHSRSRLCTRIQLVCTQLLILLNESTGFSVGAKEVEQLSVRQFVAPVGALLQQQNSVVQKVLPRAKARHNLRPAAHVGVRTHDELRKVVTTAARRHHGRGAPPVHCASRRHREREGATH